MGEDAANDGLVFFGQLFVREAEQLMAEADKVCVPRRVMRGEQADEVVDRAKRGLDYARRNLARESWQPAARARTDRSRRVASPGCCHLRPAAAGARLDDQRKSHSAGAVASGA